MLRVVDGIIIRIVKLHGRRRHRGIVANEHVRIGSPFKVFVFKTGQTLVPLQRWRFTVKTVSRTYAHTQEISYVTSDILLYFQLPWSARASTTRIQTFPSTSGTNSPLIISSLFDRRQIDDKTTKPDREPHSLNVKRGQKRVREVNTSGLSWAISMTAAIIC